MWRTSVGLLAVLCLAGPGWGADPPAASGMTLASPAFAAGGEIPALYTCQGKNLSPPLSWSNPPAGTRSLVLIVDDPDAPNPAKPKKVWDHWLLYNLPPESLGLPEAVPADKLPAGTRPAANSWKKTGYGGPCPPVGRHRYFHKLFALDVVLPDLKEPRKAELEKAMEGHVLGRVELVGTYQKTKP